MSTALPPLPRSIAPPPYAVRRKEPAKPPAERIHIGNLGIDTYSETALADHVLDHAFNGNHTRQIMNGERTVLRACGKE